MSTILHSLPSSSSQPLLHAPDLPGSEALVASLLEGDTHHLNTVMTSLHGLFPDAIARELCASPFALRAGLLGLEQGLGFTFHERRLRMPLAEHLAPEVPVWSHGELLTIWQEGVLQEPKYYSFFVDAPLPVYNPNYRGKWRSHELLHGAVGFCWRPDFTRFDAYLVARLAELLPVVHWYGWDEAYRQRCPVHLRTATPPLRECAECEALARTTPFWRAQWRDEDHAHAIASIDRAAAHFSQEWSACMAELDTGRRHETLYKNLNASRDSMGYVHGHWPRQSSWSFGAWTELFMRRGQDYLDDITQYAERVLSQTHRLLSGELQVDVAPTHASRRRRAIQDLGYRVLYTFEYLEPGTPQEQRLRDVLMPRLESLADSMDHEAQQTGALSALIEGLDAVSEFFPEGFLDLLTATGHDLLPVEMPGAAWEHAQVFEGIGSGAETLVLALEGAEVEMHDVFEGFVQSDEFERGGMLLERATAWLGEHGGAEFADFAELLGLEAFMLSMPRRDEDARTFAMPYEQVDDVIAHAGRVCLHATLKRAAFRAVILEAVFDQSYADDLDTVCPVWRVVAPDGSLSLDVCTQAHAQILDDLAHGEGLRDVALRWDRDALIELFQMGVIWWKGAK